MLTRKNLLLILALLLALGLTACGSGGSDATPEPAAPTTAASSADTQTADEPATVAPTETVAATKPLPTKEKPTKSIVPTEKPAPVVTEEGPLSLSDPASGLKNLKSYRLTWTSEWTPDDATQTPVKMKWTQEYTADPPAQSIAWSGSSEATGGEETVSTVWRIGPTTYMMFDNNGDAQCMAITQDEEEEAEPPFDPSLFSGVENATYAGRETVNGVPTKHYVYDTVDFALLGADKINGDVWVAEDGGYMVKEVLTWEGGAGPFSALAQDEAGGKGSWTWELTDINAQFTIEPPEECLNPAGDAALPIPSGATATMQTPQMTQYTVMMSVADVVAFYKKEMPAAGWSVSGEPTVMNEMAILAFTKDDKTANVMVTIGDNGGSMVMVTTE